MKKIEIVDFVNSFTVQPYKSMTFLLGAGTSVSSGILSVAKQDLMVYDKPYDFRYFM